MQKDGLPQRKHPSHSSPREQHNQSIIYFVTVCTKDRRPILDSQGAHQTILAAWQRADLFKIGRYVLMPDHLHLFCAPASTSSDSLASWISYWKSLAAAKWPHLSDKKLWQRDFWDTQLRQGESYANKWDYVRFNPVRHKLVSNPDDWPYQGEMHVLEWS